MNKEKGGRKRGYEKQKETAKRQAGERGWSWRNGKTTQAVT